MAYVKHNFATGDILFARQLNDIDNMLEELDNRTYQEIDTKSFSISPSTAAFGQTVTQVKLSYELNKTPEILTINGEIMSNPSKSGSFMKNGSWTSDRSFSLVAVDDRNNFVSKNATLSFMNYIKWGVVNNTYTYSEIMPHLSEQALSDNKARTITVNAGVSQYIWYAVPSRLGNCNFNVGGFDGGFSKIGTINYTNSYNYSEDYDIYRSDNINLGSTKVVIN